MPIRVQENHNPDWQNKLFKFKNENYVHVSCDSETETTFVTTFHTTYSEAQLFKR